MPADIARAKQAELATQLRHLEENLDRASATATEHEQLIRTLTKLAANCGQAYRDGDDETRRAYNQAWFDQLLFDTDGPGQVSTRPIRTEAVEAIQAAQIGNPRHP
ncbi:MAG TPA: hypothetical protein VHO01_05375 [Jatrophihabitans sp.]|nr:hypothetical protein [Jatrophihabitans sp.]